MKQAPKAGGLGQPKAMGWVQDGGAHVHPWLIHVDIWQKPPQYCKVISTQFK